MAKLGTTRYMIPCCLFLSCFALYLWTLTAAYTFDSVAYATQIHKYAATGKSGWLFHPHHLLYSPLGYCAWQFFRLAGMQTDPLRSLQYMNAFAGAVGAVLIFVTLRRDGLAVQQRTDGQTAGTGTLPALATSVAAATAYGYWVCATDGRVTVPALAALIAVVGLAWGMLRQPSYPQAIALAAATVIAVLLHQSNGLLISAAVGAVLLSHTQWERRVRLSLAYVATTLAGIAAAYVTIGAISGRGRGIRQLQAWMLAYAHDGRWWSLDFRDNIHKDLAALTHAFFSTESPWGLALSAAVPAGLVAAAILGLMIPIRTVLRGDWQPDGLHRRLMVIELVALPYAAFFTVWSPGYFVFWLPVAVLLLMYLATCSSALGPRWNLGWAGIALLWTLMSIPANLPIIRYRTRPENNPDLIMCNRLRPHVRPGDMILITGSGGTSISYFEVYGPYFARVSVKTVNGECKRRQGNIPNAISSLRGVIRNRLRSRQQVLVLGEFSSRSRWKAIQQHYPNTKTMRARLLEGFHMEPVVDRDGTMAYRLRLAYLAPAGKQRALGRTRN